MKKLILVLAFVFANGTLFATNSLEVKPPKYTFDQCDGFATVMGDLLELSYEEEHDLFTACMEAE